MVLILLIKLGFEGMTYHACLPDYTELLSTLISNITGLSFPLPFFSFSSVSIIFVFLSLCFIILCFLFLFYCFVFQASVLISVISFYAVISIASFILSVSSHFSTFSILHHVFPFIASFICVFFLAFPVFLFLYQYIFRLYISLQTSKTKLKSVLMTHDARKNCYKIFSK